MESLINSRMDTLKVQKNVNSGIKIGQPTMKDCLAEFLTSRKIKALANTLEQGVVD